MLDGRECTKAGGKLTKVKQDFIPTTDDNIPRRVLNNHILAVESGIWIPS